MTAQKRSQEGPPEEDDGSLQRHLNFQERTEDNDETDGSGSSTGEDKDELVAVELADMRKEVQCPICLGNFQIKEVVDNLVQKFQITEFRVFSGLDNQGLRGLLPNDTSKLRHLQSINLSGNSIHGPIPSSLGAVTSLEKLDLSYNFFNGSILESLGQLTSLQRLNLNGNSLSGRVPTALVGRLLHRPSFNFTDNAGLCGIPGLPTCGLHLSVGAKIGIALGSRVALLLIFTCLMCWWKRQQNILGAQRIAARDAPYAKASIHFSRDVQMSRHHGHENARTATENGPSLLS